MLAILAVADTLQETSVQAIQTLHQLGIKIIFFALALWGLASLWMAILADMGASLIVVLNGLSLLNFSKPEAQRKTKIAISK